jgi:glycosyltransferase involved in cell wall biosynthesis/tetratricopeptide (TPR) repeat protein
MNRIVTFANGWGPLNGGINAFNTDFLIGLRAALRPDVQLTCVVMGPAAESPFFSEWERHARAAGIQLTGVRRTAERTRPEDVDPDLLRPADVATADLYIGHDLFTGPWATGMARRVGSPVAVFHHMAPEYYKTFKGHLGDEVLESDLDVQRKVFTVCDYLFGVGPRLQESASRYRRLGELAFRFVPGLANIAPVNRNRKAFSGITIGRISAHDDVIKNCRLAIRGFAKAMRQLERTTDAYDISFHAIGLAKDDAAYQHEHHTLAEEITQLAGCQLTFLGHRFNESRETVYGQLVPRDVCYMLSRHEGFGLVGLEAIAAGVPLILSRRSGLQDLLDDYRLQDKVKTVDIKTGPETQDDKDIDQVAEATREIFGAADEAKMRATALRQALLDRGLTWESAARGFLRDCGLSNLIRDGDTPPRVQVPATPSAPWPWRGLEAQERQALRELAAWLLAGRTRTAQFIGPREPRKSWFLKRFKVFVGFEFVELYRSETEHVKGEGAFGQAQRLDALPSLRSTPGEREHSEGLVLIEAPALEAPESVAGFLWQSAIDGVLAKGWHVLIETPKPLDGWTGSEKITWRDTHWGKRPIVPIVGLESLRSGGPLAERAADLASLCVFGLSLDGAAAVLGTNPDTLAQLQYELDRGVPGLRWENERLVWRSQRKRVPSEADRTALLSWLEAGARAAIESAKAHDWLGFERNLEKGLEWIIQEARAGRARAALATFHAHFNLPLVHRFARHDLVLTVASAFFLDPALHEPRPELRQEPLLFEVAALTLNQLGQADTAARLLESALSLRRAAGAPPLEIATCCGHLALATFGQGRYQETLALLDERIRLAREAGEGRAAVRSAAIAMRAKAKVFLRLGRLDALDQALKEAERGYGEAQDPQGEPATAAYRAQLALARGDRGAAIAYAKRGLAALEALGGPSGGNERYDVRDRVRLQLVLGHAALVSPPSADLRERVEAALATAVKNGSMDFVLDALILKAEALVVLGAADEARQLATRAGSMARAFGLRPHVAEALALEARALHALGHTEEAMETARRAMELAKLDGPPYGDAVATAKAKAVLG